MRTWFFGFVFLVAAALAASMDVTASPPTAKGQTAGKSAVKGGSTERRAILDALRQELKAWTKLDVVFVVQYLREQEGWAWVAALPQSRDGKNKYEPVEALLHKDARGWKVLEMRPGGAECEEDPNCADDTRYFGKLKSRFSAAPGDIFPKWPAIMAGTEARFTGEWLKGLSVLSDIYQNRILIFGCGNILLGDDGFGPAVVKRLEERYDLPDEVLALDMGTGIREVLFDLILSDTKPEKIIIVDAVDHPGREPGEVFEIAVEDIPAKKTADFSLHQFPTVNMLKELKEHTGIAIIILVAQVQEIPEELKEGLTPAVTAAVDEACRLILRNI